MSLIIKFQEKNGTFMFNQSLDYEIWKERKRRGWTMPSRKKNYPDSPLLRRKIKNTENGFIYNIEKVYKQYHCGWYIVLLAEKNKSHIVIFWANVNCFDPEILQNIEEFRSEWKLLKKGENENEE